MKTCTKCGETKPLNSFGTRNGRYLTVCKSCTATYHAAYRAAHKEKFSAYHRARYESDPQRVAQRNKRWTTANAEKVLAKTRRYQAAKLNAIPIWTDIEWSNFVFEEAYRLAAMRKQSTGFNWEVDHIFPVQGKRVCGFHIAENIQVIPQLTNRRKSNSYDIDDNIIGIQSDASKADGSPS
jgi:hypothetical protein